MAEGLNNVLTFLDGAKTNDPNCPLFHAIEGKVCLESGPDGYERATRELTIACQLSPYWVPAHVAMAELAIRAGRPDAAGAHLHNAMAAVDILQAKTRGDGKTVPALGAFSINGLNTTPGPGQNNWDPRLPDSEQLSLTLAWLAEGELWTIENAPLLASGPGQPTMTPQIQGTLFRRLRAQVEFELVMLKRLADPTPVAVIRNLDRVLEWDPDFFPARYEKAMQLSRAGDYKSAERLLVPYVESKNEAFTHNGRLAHALAMIYVQWFDVESTPEVAAHAHDYFVRLHKLNPIHVEGWVDRACFYAKEAKRIPRPESVKSARQCLEQAVQLGYGDKQRLKEAELLIEDAAKPAEAVTPKNGDQR